MLFNVSQAGTGFLRLDEFLRQCFGIVILVDCLLRAFNSFKKFLIGFVSFTLCLPPSQLLKINHFSVRLEIEWPSPSLSVSFKLKTQVFIEMVNVACQHLVGSCLPPWPTPPYKQGPSVKFIFQPDSCCGQNEYKCKCSLGMLLTS